jgi:prepilin peptidase CpaA
MAEAEFQAMLDLVTSLLLSGRTGILMLLLASAAVMDFRSHRIPNWLVCSGAVYALIFNTVSPPWLHGTFLFPLAGLGLGLFLFLPLYLLRTMGAGDVKLLAMCGAFLGPNEIWRAALMTLITGGGLGVVFVLANGTALRVVQNLTSLFRVGLFDTMGGSAPSLHISALASAGRLPYGVAIAAGTTAYLVLHQLALI